MLDKVGKYEFWQNRFIVISQNVSLWDILAITCLMPQIFMQPIVVLA